MLKRRTIAGIVSCIAILVLAWSSLMVRGSATAVNDPSGDVEGGKIVAATGAEHYNVTCGNPPAASFIDIKSISWTDDGVNYTIIMEYWSAIDIGKILAGNIWGTIEFSVNGSTIADYQLGVGFTGAVSTWYAYETVTYTNLISVASYTTSAITWRFSKSLLDGVTGKLGLDQWVVRAHAMYVSEAAADVAWDVYNYPNFPETHGITCVTIPANIPGFDIMVIGITLLASATIIGRATIKHGRRMLES